MSVPTLMENSVAFSRTSAESAYQSCANTCVSSLSCTMTDRARSVHLLVNSAIATSCGQICRLFHDYSPSSPVSGRSWSYPLEFSRAGASNPYFHLGSFRIGPRCSCVAKRQQDLCVRSKLAELPQETLGDISQALLVPGVALPVRARSLFNTARFR